MQNLINFFVIFGIFGLSYAVQYPNDLPRCKNADGTCLNDVITKIIGLTFKGHRGLNLISFDPLHIKKMELAQNPKSPVNIQLKFTDVDLHGLRTAKIFKTIGFEKDPHTSPFEVQANFPQLQLIGPYTIKGNVLILPITGSGKSNFTFDNVKASIKFKPEVVTKDGKEFISIHNLRMDFTTTRLHTNFENLFNGDKALGDNMNLFINENWKEIFGEIKPAINDAMSAILQTVVNGPFSKFAYKDLFLPS